MHIDDITNIIRQKVTQRSQYDRNTLRYGLADYEIQAVAVEVATEISRRMTRPVITFTRNDVLTAAAASGFSLSAIYAEAGGQIAVPVDSANADIYDKLHKVVDWAFTTVLQRLPELQMQQQLSK